MGEKGKQNAIFLKMENRTTSELQDINGVDFVADAHEAAILRIVDLLRHPDDLTNKLPMLRKKIAMERASIEAQLKTVMESQLDATQRGIDSLEICKKHTETTESALVHMDQICGDSENSIKNYGFIQKVYCIFTRFRSPIKISQLQRH
jgi:exocyst complex component 3